MSREKPHFFDPREKPGGVSKMEQKQYQMSHQLITSKPNARNGSVCRLDKDQDNANISNDFKAVGLTLVPLGQFGEFWNKRFQEQDSSHRLQIRPNSYGICANLVLHLPLPSWM